MTKVVYTLNDAGTIVLMALHDRYSQESVDRTAKWASKHWADLCDRAIILRLLDEAGGDISHALKLAGTIKDGYRTTPGTRLGHWGRSWNGGWLDCWNNCPHGRGLVIHVNGYFDENGEGVPPDYEVRWRAIFEYVAGKPRQRNLWETQYDEQTTQTTLW